MQSFLTIEVTSLLGYNTRHGKLTASSLVCKVLDADHTSGEPPLTRHCVGAHAMSPPPSGIARHKFLEVIIAAVSPMCQVS